MRTKMQQTLRSSIEEVDLPSPNIIGMTPRESRSRAISLLGLVVIFLGLTYSFLTNGFAVSPYGEWAVWERGSEVMVLKRIEVDILQRDSSRLGLSAYAGDEFSVYDRLSPSGLPSLATSAPKDFTPYESEMGGQAYFWSFLWRDVGCSSVSCLHGVASALSAASVLAVFLCLSMVGSRGLGWAWLISAACSPWITYSARNLFWSPWLYFLPLVAATWLVIARTRRTRLLALAGVFLAFVVKYVGTGYHEFTAFAMLAAGVPIIAVAFNNRFARNKRQQVFNAAMVLASSLGTLILVLMAHALILSGNIAVGLNNIWVNAVLRRTYGTAANFDPAYSASLSANPLAVIWKYLWSDWTTVVLGFSLDKYGSILSMSLGRVAFLLGAVICIFIVIRRKVQKDPLWKRDASLLVLGFSIPIVWFVSAKGYSYNHTFILFFLWYFLFVPSLLFIVSAFVWQERQLITRSIGERVFAERLKRGSQDG